jgi:hypothetical protein
LAGISRKVLAAKRERSAAMVSVSSRPNYGFAGVKGSKTVKPTAGAALDCWARLYDDIISPEF